MYIFILLGGARVKVSHKLRSSAPAGGQTPLTPYARLAPPRAPLTGPPETVYTQLRIRADGQLEPWQVWQGDKLLPRADSTAVNLERDVSHTIRFGVKAE